MRPSMLFRLRGLSRSLLLASGIALAGAASAQGTAIKVLVGFPPGGGTDAIARVLADKLKDQLGVPVIVENKAGAGGQLAAQALKAAAPDLAPTAQRWIDGLNAAADPGQTAAAALVILKEATDVAQGHFDGKTHAGDGF